MFSTAEIILSHYAKQFSRFTIYSIDAHRGQNPEDIFYLCHTKNAWFLVYETDYIGALSYVVNEAKELLAAYDAHPLHWLAKKDENIDSHTINIDIPDDDKSLLKALVLDLPDTYLRYAVLEVKMSQSKTSRFNPTTYGFTE